METLTGDRDLEAEKRLAEDPHALLTILVQRALEDGLYYDGVKGRIIKPNEYVVMHASVADRVVPIEELGVTVYPGDVIPVIRKADHETNPAPLWGPPVIKEPLPKEDLSISFGNCARCQGDHKDVPARPFKTPPEHWTHWALCPKTREPILVQSGVEHARANLVEARVPRGIVLWTWDPEKGRGFVILDCGHWDEVTGAEFADGADVGSRACQRCAEPDPTPADQFDAQARTAFNAGLSGEKIDPQDMAEQVELARQITDEVIAEEKELAALRIMAGAVRDLLEQWDAGEHDLMPKLNELKRKYDLVEATK